MQDLLDKMADMAWQRARWDDAEQPAPAVPDTLPFRTEPVRA